MLWASFLLLSLPALFFWILPWLKKPHTVPNKGVETSGLLGERLAELEYEHRAGLIEQGQYEQLRDEARATFESDAAVDSSDVAASAGRRFMFPALVLLAVSISASMAVYLSASNGYQMLLQMERVADGVDQLLDDIAVLEQRLRDAPDDADSWRLLASARLALGQYRSAADAYAELDRLGRLRDDETMLNYAEALVLSEGDGDKAQRLLDTVLLNPEGSDKALFLYGILNFNRSEYRRAVQRWEELYNTAGDTMPDEMRNVLANMVAEARRRSEEAVAETASPTPPVAERRIQVSVELATDLVAEVSNNDVVFIFVRAVEGPPLPLAVRRLTVADLPVTVTLSDDDAMATDMSLSQFDKVTVFARVAKSGAAQRQAGDLIGSEDMDLTTDSVVNVVIDQVVQ